MPRELTSLEIERERGREYARGRISHSAPEQLYTSIQPEPHLKVARSSHLMSLFSLTTFLVLDHRPTVDL